MRSPIDVFQVTLIFHIDKTNFDHSLINISRIKKLCPKALQKSLARASWKIQFINFLLFGESQESLKRLNT